MTSNLLQIKETAERILAVDRAAAMIEEMLKLGQNSQSISSASPNGPKVDIHILLASAHSSDVMC